MSPELRAAIEKILNNKTFGVFTATDADETSLLTAHALVHALVLAEKILVLNDPPAKFREKWSSILPAAPIVPPRPLAITLPKKIGVQEISYAEQDNLLQLTINTKERPNLNEIRITESALKLDVIFCFANDETFLEKFTGEYLLPAKSQIVLIATGERLITEKTADLIDLLGDRARKDITVATLLFAALVCETENFQKNLSGSALTLAGTLLGFGASKEKIRTVREELPSTERATPVHRILGRALTRTYQDATTRAAWTFLLPQDFSKTDTAPAAELFSDLAQAMRKVIAIPMIHIFLWKEENGLVHSLAFASEPGTLRNLAQKFDADAALQGAAFIKLPSFQNFSAAEKGLRELLRSTG